MRKSTFIDSVLSSVLSRDINISHGYTPFVVNHTMHDIISKLSTSKRRVILNSYPFLLGKIPWAFYEWLAEKSKEIPFECDFIDGKCRKSRERGINYEKKCCCVNCARNIGFLKCINPKNIGIYAQKFTKTDGFWRKDKGCILDRKLRSIVCIKYSCHDPQNIEYKTYHKAMNNISETYLRFLIFNIDSDYKVYDKEAYAEFYEHFFHERFRNYVFPMEKR